MNTHGQAQEPVFVFGSDLDGKHESESALAAVRFHQAEKGAWSGSTGNAYVIPYLDNDGWTLPLEVIKNYVDPFVDFAKDYLENQFLIARFGCGPEAHTDEAMARLFAQAPNNCRLPGLWSHFLDAAQSARLLVFDPSAQIDGDLWRSQFEQYLALNAPLWDVPSVELVSVGNSRAIVANDKVAKQMHIKHRVFGPNDGYYGSNAVVAAEYQAVWYATHVLSVADFNQTAHPEQMRIMRAAARAGLQVDQLDVNAA